MVSTAIRSIYSNGLSLGAAVAGGFVFSALDTPIPWLLGPLAFVAGINLAGFRIGCPNGTRQVGQIVIGTAIGLRFTPDVAAIVLGQLHWMAVAAAVAVVLGRDRRPDPDQDRAPRPGDRVFRQRPRRNGGDADPGRPVQGGTRGRGPVADGSRRYRRRDRARRTDLAGNDGRRPFQPSFDPGGLVPAPDSGCRLYGFRLSSQPARRHQRVDAGGRRVRGLADGDRDRALPACRIRS